MTYTPTVWADGDCVMAADMNRIETGVDIAQGDVMNLRGLTAARPASDATLIGRKYRATDAPYEVSRDNGAGWDVVGYTNNAYTALGDIQVGTGADAAGPLGIGAAGQVLTVAAGTASWAASAAGVWTFIAETILLAPAATVTFAAIPGAYRALIALLRFTTDRAAQDRDQISCRVNADSGNNYDWFWWDLFTVGITRVTSRADTAIDQLAQCGGAAARANNWSPAVHYWPDYALVDREKFCLNLGGGDIGDVSADTDIRFGSSTGHWRNTAAITSITYFPNIGANFTAGSRAALYGIT